MKRATEGNEADAMDTQIETAANNETQVREINDTKSSKSFKDEEVKQPPVPLAPSEKKVETINEP